MEGHLELSLVPHAQVWTNFDYIWQACPEYYSTDEEKEEEEEEYHFRGKKLILDHSKVKRSLSEIVLVNLRRNVD